jgi:hypothetical protein
MKAKVMCGWAVLAAVAAGMVVAAQPGRGRAEPPDGRPRCSTTDEQLARVLEKLGSLEDRLAKIEKQLAEVQAAQTQRAPLRLGAAAADWIRSHVAAPLINRWSDDPNRRVLELLHTSEDLRQIQHEWGGIWSPDQSSHLTPEKVHGGIQ